MGGVSALAVRVGFSEREKAFARGWGENAERKISIHKKRGKLA